MLLFINNLIKREGVVMTMVLNNNNSILTARKRLIGELIDPKHDSRYIRAEEEVITEIHERDRSIYKLLGYSKLEAGLRQDIEIIERNIKYHEQDLEALRRKMNGTNRNLVKKIRLIVDIQRMKKTIKKSTVTLEATVDIHNKKNWIERKEFRNFRYLNQKIKQEAVVDRFRSQVMDPNLLAVNPKSVSNDSKERSMSSKRSVSQIMFESKKSRTFGTCDTPLAVKKNHDLSR